MNDQPPMKIEDHPEHRMPPSESYRHDNSTIFSYGAGDEKSNKGQGPTRENAEDEAYQAWGLGRSK